MELTPPLIWFLVGLALAFLEFIVPGVLLIFFTAGAWIVAVTTYLNVTDTLFWQLTVFTFTSVLLLVGLREWLQGKLYGHVTHTQDLKENLDEFTGKQVKILKEIAPGRSEGAVELKGAAWTVISDSHFAEGEMATIIGTEGIALKISKTVEA